MKHTFSNPNCLNAQGTGTRRWHVLREERAEGLPGGERAEGLLGGERAERLPGWEHGDVK